MSGSPSSPRAKHALPAFRWLRRLTLATAGTVAGVALFYALQDWQGERAWKSYRQSLMARGQRFDPTQFDPPPVPDDQNFLEAPLVRDWFAPYRTPPGAAPAGPIISITPPGNADLLGSWTESRPTNLREWRDFFGRINKTEAWLSDTSPRNAVADPIESPIVIDDVPLPNAIENLARHAGYRVRFDPRAVDLANEGKPLANCNTSIRFEQVTVHEALLALLGNYRLAMVKTATSNLFLITRALAPAPVWPEVSLNLDTAPLPPTVDKAMEWVVIDRVPARDAVRNIMHQAQINFQFDPGVASMPLATNYSLELTNVTLREVLTRVLGDNALTLEVSGETQVARVVPLHFVPTLGGASSAVAVLDSFAPFDAEFRALYRACGRPQSRLDLDYRQFVSQRRRPINFTGYRMVAQALTLHASAHLALSNGPAALQDATALLRMAQALRDPPDLTAAMIHVALSGLYVQVIWEGLAGRRWNLDQLRTLEEQLQSLDLLAACFTGWEGEQASVNCWLEQTPQAELGGQLVEEWTGYKLRRRPRPGWADPVEWAIHWSPRGWIRQMQIAYTENFQEHLGLLDPRQQRVFPAESLPSANPIHRSAGSFTPGVDLLRRVFALNSVRPEAVSAQNQTGINQARIACALERYRIAHGHFPEELRQLIPDYVERLPHDLLNGQSLRYLCTEDGLFVLYSVGWDGKDDAARSADWVWRYPAQ